jgi:transcriptional regulator with XRE-family HTH domain
MTRPEVKMSTAERRLRIAMLEQKISRCDLARVLGIEVTTLGNIIRGARCSGETRERITIALRTRIWRDIPVPAFFEPGAVLIFSHLTMAKEFHELVSSYAILRGRTMEFVKPCTLLLSRESGSQLQSRKISGSSGVNTMTKSAEGR